MGWDGDLREASRLSRKLGQAAAALAACLLVANCSSSSKLTSRVDPRYGVAASPRVVEPGQPVPKGGGVYRVGKPYQVAGVTYTPEENSRYRNEGLASWYGDDFHGRLTANGEIYDMSAISAAHPTLPMPSYVRVTNVSTRKSLIVRVNDRGPYHRNREIDVSREGSRAARLPPSRDGTRPRRVCRPRASGRLGRPPPGGDVTRRRAGAGAGRDGCVEPLPPELRPCARNPERSAAPAGAAVRSGADPTPIADLTIEAIVTHLEAFLATLDTAPILMGHSAGGAFMQVVMDHGYGCAGVGLNSAPTEGVRVTPWTQLHSVFPVLKNPLNHSQRGRVRRRSVEVRVHQHLHR